MRHVQTQSLSGNLLKEKNVLALFNYEIIKTHHLRVERSLPMKMYFLFFFSEFSFKNVSSKWYMSNCSLCIISRVWYKIKLIPETRKSLPRYCPSDMFDLYIYNFENLVDNSLGQRADKNLQTEIEFHSEFENQKLQLLSLSIRHDQRFSWNFSACKFLILRGLSFSVLTI